MSRNSTSIPTSTWGPQFSILKGKQIHALAEEGQYEIVLRVENRGNRTLTNIEFIDIVPYNFEYGDFSQEPSSFDSLEGRNMIFWVIEKIEPKKTIEICYKIVGCSSEYRASEAQVAFL